MSSFGSRKKKPEKKNKEEGKLRRSESDRKYKIHEDGSIERREENCEEGGKDAKTNKKMEKLNYYTRKEGITE
jgi:hypothetical protein